MTQPMRVAARGSKLSILQVEEFFSAYPDIPYELEIITSLGDKHKEISLLTGEAPTDIFTRELDRAILTGRADMCIHSAKDLPYPLPQGISVVCLTRAKDQSDSLVSRTGGGLSELPTGSVVGTSSPMRRRELLRVRPDLEVRGIRGTIEERVAQVERGDYDAAIVATCALQRLGMEDKITERLPFATHPLQGMLAVTAQSERAEEMRQLFSNGNLMNTQGRVDIVGFGPGDPELLTVKAIKRMQSADVIIHDDLIDISYLGQYSARKIYVGKRSGRHSAEQDEINAIMLSEVRDGHHVVRLKGGDPAIFAHTGEETEYLRRNLVEVSVIPGISAASAMAAEVGLGLTHRGVSGSVAFINGHSAELSKADADTLVYYMGGSRLCSIAAGLIERGRPADTPALIVSHVGRQDRQEYETTLERLSQGDDGLLPTPVICMIGDVAALRHKAAGGRTLYTGSVCPDPNFIWTPLIKLTATSDANAVRQSAREVATYQYVIFTSRHAARFWAEAAGDDFVMPEETKVVAIGETTANELADLGIRVDMMPETDDSHGIVKLMSTQKKGRVLIPRSDKALPIIPNGLRASGFDVTTIVAYENTVNKGARRVKMDDIDTIIFTSPSTIDAFIEIYGAIQTDKNIVCRGQITEAHLNSIKNTKTTE